MMTENACKSLRFNTLPVITTRFGRKRRTLECGLHDDHTGGHADAKKIAIWGHTDTYLTHG